MWRRQFCSSVLWHPIALCGAARWIHVKPTSSTSFTTTPVVPEFGTQRRRHQRRQDRQLREKAAIDALAHQQRIPTPDEEDDAEVYCRSRFGFLERPLYMQTWFQFQQELLRYTMRWSLTPGIGGVYHLEILEHTVEGEQVLTSLQADGNKHAPIADMFEGLCGIIQGSMMSFSVPFSSVGMDRGRPKHLVVEAKGFLESDAAKAKSATSSSSLKGTFDREYQMVSPPASGVFLRQNDPSISQRIFAQTSQTGLCLTYSVMETMSDGTFARTVLCRDLSLQTACHMHLQSIPIFLQRRDIGIPNWDFISKDQMRMFRFVWCYIRRECRMEPLEIADLDVLLPTSK